MLDRLRNNPRLALVLLAFAAALAARSMCVAPQVAEPPAARDQPRLAPRPNAEGGRRANVGRQDAGADAVAELLRRSVEAYEALGARVAEANPQPDQRALLQALRAVCAHNALQAALDAYLAEGADPVAYMRAHARPQGPDTERTCERAVLSAAGLLESEIALATKADAGLTAVGPAGPADAGQVAPPAARSVP